MGAVRFGVPEQLVLWARDTFGLRTFVETGTYRAATTIWASSHFDKVITIEGQKNFYDEARTAYGHLDRVEFLNGDSRVLLGNILDRLSEPSLVWLDAHWCGEGTFGPGSECPVLEELACTNASRFDHVVLIDDARLFIAPPPAPHRHDQWPDLLQIAHAIDQARNARYAAIFEDVIVTVPAAARDLLVEFIRKNSLPPALPEPRSSHRIRDWFQARRA